LLELLKATERNLEIAGQSSDISAALQGHAQELTAVMSAFRLTGLQNRADPSDGAEAASSASSSPAAQSRAQPASAAPAASSSAVVEYF